MTEREKKSGGAGCFICGGVLFMLLVLYVLGIGPAALLIKGNPSAADLLGLIYYPLGWLAGYCEPIERALTWYIELWTG